MFQGSNSWHPTASLSALRERAKLLKQIRAFFDSRGVFEVDTPLLCASTVSEPALASFFINAAERYLQTSPEYAMKRMLAAFNVPIYYLGKAFREGEFGKKHNPEFTMLEWYRPQWDHHQLIAEINDLFQLIFACPPLQITTYQAIFKKYLNVCPHQSSEQELKHIALKHNWIDESFNCDKMAWLDLLMTHGIESQLGLEMPVVILDYPAQQGALAKIRKDEDGFFVAERFEVYYRGMELANGYHELTCAMEQRKRFEADNLQRRKLGLPHIPVDEHLLSAMNAGMGTCAGVAIGFDRLLMLRLGLNNISDVLPFNWENA